MPWVAAYHVCSVNAETMIADRGICCKRSRPEYKGQISMPVHFIDPAVAKIVGGNAAAMYYQVRLFYGNGLDVIPDALSGSELAEMLPYLTKSQIRTSREKLRAVGLIVSKYDTRHLFSDGAVKRNNAVSRSFRKNAALICEYCGDECGPFEVDHIIPLARGGADDHQNMAMACKSCNRSKGDRLLSEWKPEEFS